MGGGGGPGGGEVGGPTAVSVVELVRVFTSLSLPPAMASIAFDEEVFAQFKEESRKQYVRMWSQFRHYISVFDFESDKEWSRAVNNLTALPPPPPITELIRNQEETVRNIKERSET